MATAFHDVPDWPEAKPAEALLGHNQPPLEERIPLEFREALLADRPDFLARLDAVVGKVNPDPDNPADLGAVARVKVTNDEELGKAGDMIKIIRAAAAHVDEVHRTVKQPYLEGGKLCDAEKNSLTGRLGAAKAKVEGIANVYIAKKAADEKAERDRVEAAQRAAADAAAAAERARVQAEQEAAQAVRNAATKEERDAALERAAQDRNDAADAAAASALAPASVTKAEPVRSDAGATISGTTDWDCRVDDLLKAFKATKNDPKVREAIEAAVKRLVKQTKGRMEIPGTTIWPVTKARFS